MPKPHVDLLNDQTHWRGQIGSAFATEAEWDAWFAAYESLFFHYADLAETYGVDRFCVGTELTGTTHRAEDWRSVVNGVRTRYGGPITYASNHSGEEASIAWWGAADIIGVDAYYPLTHKNDPTLDELRAAWTRCVATLANLAFIWGKSIIFTDIGYRSLAGHNGAGKQAGRVGDVPSRPNASRISSSPRSDNCSSLWYNGGVHHDRKEQG